MNILVADDQESLRNLAAASIKRAGHTPVLVTCGEEAVEALSVYQIDMIFLDVNMGDGLNGFETCRAIRVKYPDLKMPIVFLSANTDCEDRERVEDVGGDGYIIKPVDQALLEKTIADVELNLIVNR